MIKHIKHLLASPDFELYELTVDYPTSSLDNNNIFFLFGSKKLKRIVLFVATFKVSR